ncbi:MAG: beta-glucosidase [Moorea sp. SIO3C2]|nr:beta-glucosidase [Moorena sp. SIO3C2]
MNSLPKSLPDLNNLSLAEQVAQMVVVRASGYLFDHQIQYPIWEPPAEQLQRWLQELGIGGVILLGGSAVELALRSKQLQEWAKIPLLIAADIEEGVGQRFAGATWFPPPMALGAIAQKDPEPALQYVRTMGEITATEALAIGINWILAPVVDVNNNSQNPVINVRSFGDNPQIVSQLASAFIQGTRPYPVLTTAKHFPGHGDTATDSHLDLPVLPHSPPRLATVELPPFTNAIAAGVDAIMTAHLLITAWDDQHPATLSERILTQLLRTDLGFEGLIVTDALVMGAIANRYGADEATVMAVEAGADILLMPLNPETAIKAVCQAVEQGRISRERIQASVERISRAKRKVGYNCQREGLDENSAAQQIPSLQNPPSQPVLESGLDDDPAQQPITFQPNPNWLSQLAQPTTLTTVVDILQASQITRGFLALSSIPSSSNQPLRNLILVDDLLACDFLGQHTPAVALPRRLGYKLQLVDSHTTLPSEVVDNPVGAKTTLLQLFIRGNPFRGSAGLTAVARAWLKMLLKTGDLQALVIYGSPYVLEQFLPELPPETPYVFSYGQMPAAQAIALEALLPESSTIDTFVRFI